MFQAEMNVVLSTSRKPLAIREGGSRCRWHANCNKGGMGRETILLIEDDLPVSRALEQALKIRRYGVIPAVNRQQALFELARNHVDIALLDLNLGVDRGWETFHHLRHFSPGLPIIVMSAQPDQFANVSACFAAGLLEKPFDVKILFQQLAALSPHAAGALTNTHASRLVSVVG